MDVEADDFNSKAPEYDGNDGDSQQDRRRAVVRSASKRKSDLTQSTVTASAKKSKSDLNADLAAESNASEGLQPRRSRRLSGIAASDLPAATPVPASQPKDSNGDLMSPPKKRPFRNLANQLAIDMQGGALPAEDLLTSPQRITRRGTKTLSTSRLPSSVSVPPPSSYVAPTPAVTSSYSAPYTAPQSTPLLYSGASASLASSNGVPHPAPPAAQQFADNRTCTFSEFGAKYIKQEWYDCRTCGLAGNDGDEVQKGVCAPCASRCHEGHDVRPHEPFIKTAYCDCGAQGDAICCAYPLAISSKSGAQLGAEAAHSAEAEDNSGWDWSWTVSALQTLLLFLLVLALTGITSAVYKDRSLVSPADFSLQRLCDSSVSHLTDNWTTCAALFPNSTSISSPVINTGAGSKPVTAAAKTAANTAKTAATNAAATAKTAAANTATAAKTAATNTATAATTAAQAAENNVAGAAATAAAASASGAAVMEEIKHFEERNEPQAETTVTAEAGHVAPGTTHQPGPHV